jgi:hypothetical protein
VKRIDGPRRGAVPPRLVQFDRADVNSMKVRKMLCVTATNDILKYPLRVHAWTERHYRIEESHQSARGEFNAKEATVWKWTIMKARRPRTPRE